MCSDTRESSVFLQKPGLGARSAPGTAATLELFHALCRSASVSWFRAAFFFHLVGAHRAAYSLGSLHGKLISENFHVRKCLILNCSEAKLFLSLKFYT